MDAPRREDLERFATLTYDDFRRLAVEPDLSPHQRIGFPDAYREGFEAAIFADILAKLPALAADGATVLEIGPGCGPLPVLLAEHCAARGQELVWVDAPEMLELLPAGPHIRKVAGRFPEVAGEVAVAGRADAVLAYSVLHYALGADGGRSFLTTVLDQIAPGGGALVGDVPNESKRERFFASEAGRRFHRAFVETAAPQLPERTPGPIDDAALEMLVGLAHVRGFDAYVVPQPADLPMANRRDDLLVLRP